jgi:phage FluMu protein Com
MKTYPDNDNDDGAGVEKQATDPPAVAAPREISLEATPPPPQPRAYIPPGFERCPVCGEFNGMTRAGNLGWNRPVIPVDTGDTVSVTCLCRGMRCKRCGKMMHRPGSCSYDEKTNTVSYLTVMAGMFPCAECRNAEALKRKS